MAHLARPQLHATALNMQCGEAFRRRYIEGEIIPPGVAAIVGTATDRSVTKNLQQKIDRRELMPIEEVADTARDGLEVAWQGGVTLDDDEVKAGIKTVKGAAIDKAVRLAVLHAEVKAPEIDPTHVQRSWSLEVPGYPFDLVGTLDIQEGAAAVRDTKTTAKTPAEDIADKSLQLTAYALAVKVLDGAPPEKVALDYLIDTKLPQTKTYESARGPADFAALLARVDTVSLAIERGVFVPVSPDHWACNAKWCGYWRSCKYVTQPKQFGGPLNGNGV